MASTQMTLYADTARSRACLDEMQAFIRGGVPGLARLQRVLPSLFEHYAIPDAMRADLVHQCELHPFYDVPHQRVSFHLHLEYP